MKNAPDEAAADDRRFASGPLWKDRYRIEREIGRGGFGIVYLARDEQLLSKPVVIKILQNGSSDDPYFQKKFRQEIEALARIDHPGVVGVLDVGDTPEHRPFLVMQFVEGVTLRSQIDSGGMDFRRVANIIRQVGHALGAAHDKGVFHRDLKPENIMLQQSSASEEHVRLIDFGIASIKDPQFTGPTETSKAVGTLAYMAPEQVLGKSSGASDIYAMGVVAYEMLTGRRPENSPSGSTLNPGELRLGIPAAAQDAIIAALSYQPEKRPATPAAFGEQLARSLLSAPASSAQQVSLPATLEMTCVLFMDLVSYSTLPMDVQSERIQQLQQIVRSTSEYQRAQEADQLICLPTGDGMALVFSVNPVAPVLCAIEIFRALKSHPDLKLRMGVHTGPVYRIADINTNQNVAGEGINLAQRVMDCGDAGHILVSKTLADILGQLSNWAAALHDLGDVEVKHGVRLHVFNLCTDNVGNPNIPHKLKKEAPVAAAILVQAPTRPMDGLAERARRNLMAMGRKRWAALAAVLVIVVALLFPVWSRVFRPGSAQRELAVLRFKNVGDDPANLPFCDGVVETLSSKLSELDQFQNEFRVKAASEVRDITSAREAHRVMGVDLAVTGSVQRLGDNIQLTVNVVDAASGTLIHASTINTEVAKLSTVQDELVVEVGKLLLRAPLPQPAMQALNSRAKAEPVAYDAYVQGVGYLQDYESVESIDKAIDFFGRALERDSRYALAYAGLGEAYWRKYDLTKSAQFAELGQENCQKALQLNDQLAQVYVTLALISNGVGRYEDAVDQAKKSIKLNAVNASAYRELAKAYDKLEKSAEAEKIYQTAIATRPNDWGSYNELGRFYYQHGRLSEAEVQFRRVIKLAPGNVRGYSNLGGIYQQLERYAEAEEMLKKSIEIRPSAPAYSNLGTIYYYHLHHPADAVRMFEMAANLNTGDYRLWRNLAIGYYWGLHERNKAQVVYRKAIELGEQQLRINRRNQVVLIALADSYAMTGQSARAQDYLAQAMTTGSLDKDSMPIVAGIYEALGQRSVALQWIVRALCAGYPRDMIENDPGFAEVRSDPSFETLTRSACTSSEGGK